MSGVNALYDPATGLRYENLGTLGKAHTIGYLWNTGTLAFEVPTVSSGGSGGNVIVTNWPTTQAVSIASSVAVTGPLTDAQIRATPLPVSGTIAVSNMVAQGLTDTELRATPVPITGAFETNLAKLPGLSIPIHDYISQAQNATQDIWTYKIGGAGGSLVATVTVTYTDSTKAVIFTVAKT